MKLVPAGGAAEAGQVVLKFTDTAGAEHELALSVFDVSTLVSLLYELRSAALKQERDPSPEVMLPVTEMRFAEAEGFSIVRLTVAPGLHHDYAAPQGSPIANVLAQMAVLLANEDVAFGPSDLKN